MPDIRTVLTDLLTRVGLNDTTPDFDVKTLSGKLDGMVISKRTNVRSHVSELIQAFQINVVESEGVLIFKKQDGTIRATILEDELIALNDSDGNAGNNSQGVKYYEEVITREDELPKQIDLSYSSRLADYQVGTQSARRIITTSENIETVEFNLVLTDDKARQIADILLYDAWETYRSIKFKLSNKYSYLEVGDVITITLNGIQENLRIRQITQDILTMQFEAVPFYPQTYSSTATGSETSIAGSSLLTNSIVVSFLLDIPLLRDADDGIGYYMTGSKDSDAKKWVGGSLFQSKDEGVSYQALAEIRGAATYGVCQTTLGATGGYNVFDSLNTLSVLLTVGTLSSKTELQVLNGENAALLGNGEIIQFQTATLTAPNTYTLSNLLRGRMGTEHLVGTHGASESFLLLTTYDLKRMVQDQDSLNKLRKYKAVANGTELADASENNFTNTGISLRPYSVSNLLGEKNLSNNDWQLTWTRRTRVGGSWVDNADASLGEDLEQYDIEIMNGGTVVRTVTNNTTQSYTYTSADQVADFGSNQTTLTVKVYQKSTLYGRGIVTVGTF